MTTRFGVAELADMLGVSVDAVREAVEVLAASEQLTAETFLYAERNWRIAPSDVKHIKQWVENQAAQGRIFERRGPRRVIKRKMGNSSENQRDTR